MMRILYITPNFTIGGTEGQIFNIAINLDKSRFVPYVVSVGPDYGQRLEYTRHGIKTAAFRIFDTLSLVSFVRQNKIDIVHSFYYGNFSGWELLVAKMGDVRTFITSRRNMGYWRRGRHLIFDIFRNSFTDIIIANSYAVREKSIIDEKLPPPQVIVIYNGIDLSRYGDMTTSAERAAARRELGIDDREKVIGMISNIKNIKGYDYFLGAAKLIKNKGYAAKFVIAGDGSDEPAFQDSVRRHGLGGSLLLLGLCKDVSKAFGVMDIFMYSSLSEGFPNIILEAMAAGKAIVATDVGGTSEMLQDGYSGLLVPPRHSDALAEAAISLLDDERMACRLAEAARNSARWYFSMDECVKQYEYIYESMYEKKIKSSKAR